MTEPEQPEQPQLTRKQLRQIRNTAANQIIVPGAKPSEDVDAEAAAETAARSSAVVEDVPPAAPLPRAAVPVDVAPAPSSDASVDLGVSPLTRRQARQQERIRTASVPVITPEVSSGHVPMPSPTVDEVAEEAVGDRGEGPTRVSSPAAVTAASAPAPVTDDDDRDDDADVAVDTKVDDDDSERPVLAPTFGAELLADPPKAITQPATFDQILERGTSTSGSGTAANALILSQTPDGALMGPVAATGEVLVTGSFVLPEGLGSQGHARGTADGREVDAVLVDGELPAHSSPTPIAASSAISTVKATGEIIRPPAPEKGSRLMLSLAITAGVLALALVGVLILAFVTGVF